MHRLTDDIYGTIEFCEDGFEDNPITAFTLLLARRTVSLRSVLLTEVGNDRNADPDDLKTMCDKYELYATRITAQKKNFHEYLQNARCVSAVAEYVKDICGYGIEKVKELLAYSEGNPLFHAMYLNAPSLIHVIKRFLEIDRSADLVLESITDDEDIPEDLKKNLEEVQRIYLHLFATTLMLSQFDK